MNRAEALIRANLIVAEWADQVKPGAPVAFKVRAKAVLKLAEFLWDVNCTQTSPLSPHPTCVEVTGNAEMAEGHRAFVCGPSCPPIQPPASTPGNPPAPLGM